MLDNLLNLNLASVALPDSYQPPAKEGDILMTDPKARVRLSHSTLGTVRGCERRFQKAKLLRSTNPRDETPATSFGKAFGAGSQHYMVLRSSGVAVAEALDAAIWLGWASYNPPLEDDRRTQERMIEFLIRSVPFLEARLLEYEIAEFNGRPANELSFSLEINDRYYYVGFIDLVVKSKATGKYHVVDLKTTTLTAEDMRPYYRFSDQGIGYSVILDKIANQRLREFEVSYWLTRLRSKKEDFWTPQQTDLTFQYSIRDRFNWFMKLYLDVNYLEALEQLEVYPQRGGNCMSYNRVCNFYHECGQYALDTPAVYEPDDTVYDFTFDLSTLLDETQEELNSYIIATER